MNNQDIKILIRLLKLFENRPYHLSKYLLDNNALTDDFLKNLRDSKKISNLNLEETRNFTSISQMEDFYTSLINDIEEKSEKDIENELNEKLKNLIRKEKYEEAAKLRDYMIRNDIKIF